MKFFTLVLDTQRERENATRFCGFFHMQLLASCCPPSSILHRYCLRENCSNHLCSMQWCLILHRAFAVSNASLLLWQIASRQTYFLMACSQILSSPKNKYTFWDITMTSLSSYEILHSCSWEREREPHKALCCFPHTAACLLLSSAINLAYCLREM